MAVGANRTPSVQGSAATGFFPAAPLMDWIKSNNNMGWEPADADHGGPAECRVAIASMTLHKEGPAQQSIIQYAR
jgi:hypothetical protein